MTPEELDTCPRCGHTQPQDQTTERVDCKKCRTTYYRGYIKFGDYCISELNMTCQYGYYLLEGLAGHPKLKTGLRLQGSEYCYHSIWIHKDDASIFKGRYLQWLNGALDR